MRKIFLVLVFTLIISACGGGSDSADSERLEELQEQIESLQEEIAQTTTTVGKTTTTKTAPSTTTTTTTVISEPSTTTSIIPSSTSAAMEETPSSVNKDSFQEINMQITSLPENLDFLAPHFSKHLNIWGTKIIATPGTPDEKVIHAANILAEYLDNDENGIPDDDFVISALAKNKSMITMAATELDFEKTLDKIDGLSLIHI